MPKGQAKRTVTPALKAAQIANLAKARAATVNNPKCQAAKSRNARKAASVRTAKAILRHMPLGVKVGDEFFIANGRGFRVIDPNPLKTDSGQWSQRFEQFGKFTTYRMSWNFSGIVRIVWDYEPTVENIMDAPRLEEEEQKED